MVRHPDTGLRARMARYWLAPLPPPPERLRRGPWRPDAFPSRRRSTALTSRLGLWLGVAFGICFVTGLLSHAIQHPPGWFWWPSRPVRLYQVTQGLHVITGLASAPLLVAKLWSVYPRLFTWPPARTVAHAAERGAVAVLVAASLFQVVSGILNIFQKYALMPFFFTAAHHWVGWLLIGAMLIHLGTRPRSSGRPSADRRRLLLGVGAAAGLITLVTAGQTVRPLAPVALLAPRRPGEGPQGLPVNRTATAAGVVRLIHDPAYRIILAGPGGERSLDLAALNALPQHSAILPIACVEGWSSTATWTGVRLRDLVALAGADPDRAVAEVESVQAGGRYRASVVAPEHVRDPLTLIALRLRGEVLHADHGYPARLIAPNRPGVLQTKWVGRITVREES